MNSIGAKKALPLWVGLLLAGCLLGYYTLVPKRTCFYRSVTDTSTNPTPWRSYVRLSGRAEFLITQPPSFMVNQGTLYLQVRQTTSLPLFMAVLHAEDKAWSIEELQEISSSHVELKGLWPSPQASNLGVGWISQNGK
jgi:hypothetical protein